MSAPPRPSRVPESAPPPAPGPRTLADARAAFLAAVRRDTPGTDLARYTAVLDALLAWAAAHPAALAFRTDVGAAASADAIRFARVGAAGGGTGVFLAVRPVRAGAPTLEITPGGPAFAEEDRARAVATLNAHSRAVLAADDRLRIGFGALKNAAALAAVLALLDDLLGARSAADPDGRGEQAGEQAGERAGERAEAPPPAPAPE